MPHVSAAAVRRMGGRDTDFRVTGSQAIVIVAVTTVSVFLAPDNS